MIKTMKKPKIKTPKIKPKKFHLSYRSLVSDYPNWGLEKENKKEFLEEKKSPSDSTLQFAFLTKIVVLLVEIRDEVKRGRILK